MQVPNISAAKAQSLSRRPVAALETLKNKEYFESFRKNSFQKATKLNAENPKLPREEKGLIRIEECFSGDAAPDYHTDLKSFYRQTLHKVLILLFRQLES